MMFARIFICTLYLGMLAGGLAYPHGGSSIMGEIAVQEKSRGIPW
jgi:hypothetical protein